MLHPEIDEETGEAGMNSCSISHYHEDDSIEELKEALEEAKN